MSEGEGRPKARVTRGAVPCWPSMASLPLVVVGGSAGALPVLRALLGALAADFPAPILVVQHLSASGPSVLPELLSHAGPLRARHPQDGEEIAPGVVYVASPDHHLLVDGDRVAVTRGPKENRFRPSVDALFRSAAYTRGADVVGVVLSGVLDDGTSGLWTVKRRGGVAVVQHPEEAEFPDMPLSALREVDVDHITRARDLGALLTRLARAPQGANGEGRMNERKGEASNKPSNAREDERLRIEVGIAREENPLGLGVTTLGEASLLTCPECHGSLVQFEEGGALRFRCHTGHAYTATSLLAEQATSTENQAYQLQRAIEESVLLMRQMARLREASGDAAGARAFHERAREAEERADRVRALALRAPPGAV